MWPERRSPPRRRSRPERRSCMPASRASAARRSEWPRSMSAVVRLFSRSRIRSRSSARSLCSSSWTLTTRASVPLSPSSRSRAAMASASFRSSTTPAGVHTPGRRTGPRCRHRRTMTTKSRLPRIVPPWCQAVQTACAGTTCRRRCEGRAPDSPPRLGTGLHSEMRVAPSTARSPFPPASSSRLS